jgi:hypothetical protein
VSALNDPSVRGPHPDGTYTIVSDVRGDADWTIRNTATGWEATHPDDGWFDQPDATPCRWATAEDAATAVIGNPTGTVLFDGRTYGEVFGR